MSINDVTKVNDQSIELISDGGFDRVTKGPYDNQSVTTLPGVEAKLRRDTENSWFPPSSFEPSDNGRAESPYLLDNTKPKAKAAVIKLDNRLPRKSQRDETKRGTRQNSNESAGKQRTVTGVLIEDGYQQPPPVSVIEGIRASVKKLADSGKAQS